jgi:hypothetical protein
MPQLISFYKSRSINLVLEQGFLFGEGFPPSKDSNNPLAVELESENDPACQNFSVRRFKDFTSVEAAAPAPQQ